MLRYFKWYELQRKILFSFITGVYINLKADCLSAIYPNIFDIVIKLGEYISKQHIRHCLR